MKTWKLLIALLAVSSLLTAGEDKVEVSEDNCLKLLSGSPREKIAALIFIAENEYDEKEIKKKLEKMLNEQSENDEVLIKTMLAAGKIQHKKCTETIQNIYQNSDKTAIRFACVLSLLDMQDISSLKFVREANDNETDPHTKQVLQKIVDALNE
ncbi:MAG TPA: hypothetical protein VKS21_08200 [Spirochaetota bacterium]|nr:hypothetical protein [Spirochaetota bacterium]